MRYQEQLNLHLAEYKRAQLGRLPSGEFRHRGVVRSYEHILPRTDMALNLLPEHRARVLKAMAGPPRIKVHQYFHHLNSSQAFALNLFVPFFGDFMGSDALLRAMGQRGPLADWLPEAIPHTSEGTNLDAWWDNTDGVRTFCEVKLSERDFGKAKNDARHRAKLADIYRPVLRHHLDPQLCEPVNFFGSYQILRNIWHMVGTDGSRLVFLMPRANVVLWKQLAFTLKQVVPETRARVSSVAIEDVLEALVADTLLPDNWREYARRLREKYVPAAESDPSSVSS